MSSLLENEVGKMIVERQCEIPHVHGKGSNQRITRLCPRMTTHVLPDGRAICKSHLSAWRTKENKKMRTLRDESEVEEIRKSIGLGYVKISDWGEPELRFGLNEARDLLARLS